MSVTSYAADASAATGVSERTVRRKLYVQVDKTSAFVQQPRDEELLDAAALPTGAVNYRPGPGQPIPLKRLRLFCRPTINANFSGHRGGG